MANSEYICTSHHAKPSSYFSFSPRNPCEIDNLILEVLRLNPKPQLSGRGGI